MSSSTSSSDIRVAAGPATSGSPTQIGRSHLLSVLVVIVVQVVLSLYLSRWGGKLNYDRKRVAQFPEKARILSAQSGVRAAFVGNSLAIGGYGDFSGFLQAASAGGHSDYHCEMMGLYGSTLAEWFYVFKHSYIDANRPLDVLVINLSPGSEADPGYPYPRIGWLPQEGGLGNVPEIVTWAMPRFEARGDYLAATVMPPFAYREELRPKCQWPFMSHYLEGWGRMNDVLKATAKAESSLAAAPASTHKMIARMMQLARERGIIVVVVAMPVRDFYELNTDLLQCIKDAGADLIDARRIDGLTPDKFTADHWHMTRQGAEVFARFMGKQLPVVVAERRIARMAESRPAW